MRILASRARTRGPSRAGRTIRPGEHALQTAVTGRTGRPPRSSVRSGSGGGARGPGRQHRATGRRALRRATDQLRARHPDGCQDTIGQGDREGPPRTLRKQLAERIEARVRIDAACAGLRQIVSPSNGSPDACAEMPDGRSRRTGRLVEVDEAVVDSRRDGDRRRELRHRCPPEASLRVAVLARTP